MRKGAVAAVLVAPCLVAIAACSAIVSNAIPDFKCAGTGPDNCPTGTVCDLASGHCIVDLGDAGGDEIPPDDDGGDGDVPESGKDTGPTIGQLGDSCGIDGDCQSGLCGTSTLLSGAITTSGPICTETCCKSEDCPSGFVCLNAGTGGSYCVPAANAQRKPPASGGETAGSTCVGDGDCRSGLCANNRCLDTCCVQSDCAAGSTCAVASVAKHDVWVCVETVVGARNLGTTCAAQTECKNDNCVQSAGSANPAVCTPSCCSSASCDAQGFTGYHCAYGTSGTDQLKWCVKTASGGGLFPLGTSCQQSLECQSTYCDPELKKCLSPCCKDSDCAASEACRPSALSTPFLRCVPKAR